MDFPRYARLLLPAVLIVALSGCATGSPEVYQVGVRALASAEYSGARHHLQSYLDGETESYESSRARYELARLTYLGLGGPADERAAAELLERELQKPFSVYEREARHLLAEIYRRGQAENRDVSRSLVLLRAADYPRALIDLAMIYWSGELVEQDRKQAVALIPEIGEVESASNLFHHRALAEYCGPDTRDRVPAWACLDEEAEFILQSADEVWRAGRPDTDAGTMRFLATLYPALVDPSAQRRVAWYRYAGDKGSARAQYMMAQIYGAPDSPWFNPAEAEQWLQRSADQNYPKALLARGVALARGQQRSEADYLEALDQLERAADLGEKEANLWLAHLYLNPADGRSKRVGLAVARLEQIEREDDRAKHLLADIYLSSLPGMAEEQHRRALELLEGMAYRDAEAAYKLGAIYSQGLASIPPSLVDAVGWLRRAADKGHLPAQLLLARELWQDGRDESAAKARERFVLMPVADVPENLRQAVSNARYRQAMYYAGQAEVHTEEIRKLLEMAAEEENMAALAYLGLMYYRGEQVAADDELAYQYLERWDSLYQQRKDQAKSDDSVWSGLLFDERFGNEEVQDALLHLRLRKAQSE